MSRDKYNGRKKGKIKRRNKKLYLKVIGLFLMVFGICFLVYPLLTNLYTNYGQRELRQEWEEEKKNNQDAEDPVIHIEITEVAPTEITTQTQPQKIPSSMKIIIPKIGLDVMVVEGTEKADLKKGPGHMKGTAYPGENGTCVISGHRTTYGASFNKIEKLVKGDEIILETPDNRYTYYVRELKVVKPTDTWVVKQTPTPTLVLTTCHPPRSAAERLIIFADFDEERALY